MTGAAAAERDHRSASRVVREREMIAGSHGSAGEYSPTAGGALKRLVRDCVTGIVRCAHGAACNDGDTPPFVECSPRIGARARCDLWQPLPSHAVPGPHHIAHPGAHLAIAANNDHASQRGIVEANRSLVGSGARGNDRSLGGLCEHSRREPEYGDRRTGPRPTKGPRHTGKMTPSCQPHSRLARGGNAILPRCEPLTNPK